MLAPRSYACGWCALFWCSVPVPVVRALTFRCLLVSTLAGVCAGCTTLTGAYSRRSPAHFNDSPRSPGSRVYSRAGVWCAWVPVWVAHSRGGACTSNGSPVSRVYSLPRDSRLPRVSRWCSRAGGCITLTGAYFRRSLTHFPAPRYTLAGMWYSPRSPGSRGAGACVVLSGSRVAGARTATSPRAHSRGRVVAHSHNLPSAPLTVRSSRRLPTRLRTY